MSGIPNYTSKELKEATSRGAALLDKHIPGWYKRVNLAKLHMGSPTMCMLGQLFGANTETAIAKEMFPELWEETDVHSGYSRGRKMLGVLEHVNVPSMQPIHNKLDIDKVSDFTKLDIACAGFSTKCFWAEEVANRIAADEEAKNE